MHAFFYLKHGEVHFEDAVSEMSRKRVGKRKGLGEKDADVCAAVVGALLGAVVGNSGVPRELIVDLLGEPPKEKPEGGKQKEVPHEKLVDKIERLVTQSFHVLEKKNEQKLAKKQGK